MRPAQYCADSFAAFSYRLAREVLSARHTALRGASHEALLAKQWRYDAAGDVVQKGDQRYGVVSYRYDPTGRIEQASGPGLPSQRMADGKAPRMRVEVLKNGQRVVKDVSMELPHTNIPQRVGGPSVHSASNLTALTPWQHEAVDPFRNTGETLLRVIKGIDIW